MTNATTGNDRIVPGQSPAEEQSPRLARLARPAFKHWQFTIVVLAAIVMRVIVMLGYRPILWFNDSYNYIQDAITHVPDEVRPNGYPFFLDLLLPLHSLYPVALLQAAMGVGLGVAIYALLRHRGLPWWGAILPTLAGPVRLLRAAPRAHGHRRPPVHLPRDDRGGDPLLE